MNLNLTKSKPSVKHKKDGRINPHRLWILFITIFLIVLIVEIIVFTYFFINSSKELDAPVEANLEANTSQIKKIEQLVQKTEEAVKIRKGELPSSQNESSIVQ
jgi:flagellar basal body-associated protein FliL